MWATRKISIDGHEMLGHIVACISRDFHASFPNNDIIHDLRLFSSDAFFLRTFTFVCTIGINERVYVF